jgi:hypothetical protein
MMRSRSVVVILALVLTLVAPVLAAPPRIRVVVDGQELRFDVPAQNIGGRTMVPGLAPYRLYIHRQVIRGHRIVFPHSEILGSTPVYRLPEAYRRLLRLSSPLHAKTSTEHP